MIYDLDVKGMRKMIRKFSRTAYGISRTAYGRTVFTLAYAAFFFFLILTVLFLFGMLFGSCLGVNYYTLNTLMWILGCCFAAFLSFLIGSAYYYKELRIYVKNLDE